MENFFSSYDLFVKLKQLNFRATGTVWENRLNGCTITNTKARKKKEAALIIDQKEILK